MDSTFSRLLRSRLCARCCGVVPVPVEGGAAECAACGERIRLPPRRDTRRGPDGSGAWSGVGEAELARLVTQANERLEEPERVARRLGDATTDTEGDEARLGEAWRQAFATRASGPEHVEDFYWLTLRLARQVHRRKDEQRLRAVLETAIETVASDGYEQLLRGRMACHAARAGDVAAADDWLAGCERRPHDIHADSAFRHARAYVSTRKRDYRTVLLALGHEHGAVTLSPERSVEAALLRANAIERQGDTERAIAELVTSFGQAGQPLESFDLALARHADLALCPRTYWSARDRYSAQAALAPAEPPAERQKPRWPWAFAVLAWLLAALAACWALLAH